MNLATSTTRIPRSTNKMLIVLTKTTSMKKNIHLKSRQILFLNKELWKRIAKRELQNWKPKNSTLTINQHLTIVAVQC